MAIAERPISNVLHDIAGNVQEIVRAEMRLAKTEITEELGKARLGGTLAAMGALMLGLGMLFALLAAVYALSLVMPAWAAALIVAGVECVSGLLLLMLGVGKFKTVRAAPKTQASIKENVEWAKQLSK